MIGVALVGHHELAAVLANPQKLAALTQKAFRGVIQGVGFEGSWGVEMETEVSEALLQLLQGLDCELQFDFRSLHGRSISPAAVQNFTVLRDFFDSVGDADVGYHREVQTERLLARNAADISRAAELLRSGATVAFPTETVYGLGANALDPEAVEKIFLAKKRPHWDPLIVHIARLEQLAEIAEAGVLAERLIAAFWPGPLTLLLPRTAAVPDAVTAGRALVGVRMPAHPVALELLRQAGVPVAAPSANTFGHTSPTMAEHVLEDLDTRIAAVLDGGATLVGLESTVVEIIGDGIVVYRPGAVTVAMLEEIMGPGTVHLHQVLLTAAAPASLPSPGVGLRHYAPRARLTLVAVGGMEQNALIETTKRLQMRGETVGAMLPDGWAILPDCSFFSTGPWEALEVFAQRMFAGLRELDDRGVSAIVCPVPLGEGIAAAIRDRLEKAAMVGL